MVICMVICICMDGNFDANKVDKPKSYADNLFGLQCPALQTSVQCPFPESSIVVDKKVQKQDLKNIKNVKRCRDGMPKSMQTR